MKTALRCALYSTILCLVSSLQCYSFKGAVDHAIQKQVPKTCEGRQVYCSSSFITYGGMLEGKVLVKGCTEGLGDSCNSTHTTPLKGIQTKQSTVCCNTDLCNQELLPVSNDESQKWGLDCLACHGAPLTCGGSILPTMQCGSNISHCLQVSVTAAFGQESQKTLLKSCSNSSACPGLSAFSNGENPVSYSSNYQCCTGTQCNSGTFTETDPGAENGLECYSRSSPNSVSTMRCRGEMMRCTDLTGTSAQDVIMSGCGTDAFCRGLYPKFHLPGWSQTSCCSTSLCNRGNNTIAQES
ncbi:urokinase plasminogen activator surface receptor-like [Pelodytes ibericus]